jgi:hypothetical protein
MDCAVAINGMVNGIPNSNPNKKPGAAKKRGRVLVTVRL